MTPPVPDLILYTRAGCHLCDDARHAIDVILAERTARGVPVPRLVVHDIEADPELLQTLFERIPVVELGGGRLELATSMSRVRRLVEDIIDHEQHALPGASPARD